MAMNFPTTAAENQLFTPNSRAYYMYKGGRWEQVMGRTMRNRIVNPAMQVSQINADAASGVTNYYPADNWHTQVSGSGAVSTYRIGDATSRSLFMIVTTATTDYDYLMFRQNIEGWKVRDFMWGTADAKPVILSFLFRPTISGQFSISLRSSTSDRSFVQAFTVTPAQANQWVRQTFLIPGDTTGTWNKNNTLGMNLLVVLASKTFMSALPGWQTGNYHGVTGQVNGWGTSSNMFQLTDVSLSLDPNGKGTLNRYDLPGVFDAYRECQRYVEKAGVTTAGGLPYDPYLAWGYKNQKRTTPAMSFIAPGGGASGATATYLAHDGTWGFRMAPQATGPIDHVVLLDARV